MIFIINLIKISGHPKCRGGFNSVHSKLKECGEELLKGRSK